MVEADGRFRGKEKRARCAQGMICYGTVWLLWLLGFTFCGYCIYIIRHVPEAKKKKKKQHLQTSLHNLDHDLLLLLDLQTKY